MREKVLKYISVAKNFSCGSGEGSGGSGARVSLAHEKKKNWVISNQSRRPKTGVGKSNAASGVVEIRPDVIGRPVFWGSGGKEYTKLPFKKCTPLHPKVKKY